VKSMESSVNFSASMESGTMVHCFIARQVGAAKRAGAVTR
jgi:hypothetical protein